MLDVVALLGVERRVSMIEEQMNALDGDAWQPWIDPNYRVATGPSIDGCVEHLLTIVRKS